MRIITDNALRDMLRDVYIEGLKTAQRFHVASAIPNLRLFTPVDNPGSIRDQAVRSVCIGNYVRPVTRPKPPAPKWDTHQLHVVTENGVCMIYTGIKMREVDGRLTVETSTGDQLHFKGAYSYYTWTPLPEIEA